MALLQALEREGVRCCVLRNYEGFPDNNLGHDVDFLIRSADLPRAIAALRSLQGIRIAGATVRAGGPSLFLEGVSPAPGLRALQVDFITSLNWKGMPHLSTEAILDAAIPRQARNLNFLVPSPVHEAIISLLSSLLVGGWLKEKYFPSVQRTFLSDRAGVISALQPGFGLKAAARLADAVVSGDRGKILSCVGLLRASLALRALLREPLRSSRSVVCHYASELAIRYSPRSLETVSILGLDECRTAAILAGLLPMLQSTAKLVEKRPLRPQPLFASDSAPASSGAFALMAIVVLRLVEEWRSQCAEKKSLTLHLRAHSSRELLIYHPSKCRSGSRGLARLIARLFPSSDLWILLDPADEGVPSTNPELPCGETDRQREACRAFVKTRKNYVILDASQPLAELTEEAFAAIIEALARSADRELRKRFQ